MYTVGDGQHDGTMSVLRDGKIVGYLLRDGSGTSFFCLTKRKHIFDHAENLEDAFTHFSRASEKAGYKSAREILNIAMQSLTVHRGNSYHDAALLDVHSAIQNLDKIWRGK